MSTTTDKLLARLNELRGLVYPQIGYCYFADIKGDGSNRKSVWVITNANSGVGYDYECNGASARQRCENIRDAIAKEESTFGASVHRFHEFAAIHIGTGATVYLTASEARKLAKGLTDCAKSIESVKFTESHFRTVEVPLPESAKTSHRQA